MNILVTNDDGNAKPGIASLEKILSDFGNVHVVAPERDQSGTSHSLTLHEPLQYRKVHDQKFVVSGTPADCVHFAIHHLWDKGYFDFCASGINHGANIGDDVWYSGTVGGAIEASLHGIPSIAISMLPDDERSYRFDRAEAFLGDFFKTHLQELWDPQVVPNMNIPANFQEGTHRWTRLGPKRYLSHIDVREDPRGNNYFWIGGTLDDLGTDTGTDSHTVASQIVSVTPLSLDLTHSETLQKYSS